jgi:hypothetical protein
MEIEVAQIESGFPGAGDSENAVGVRLVVGAQASGLVNSPDKIRNPGIKDSRVFRVGDQKAGGAGRNGRPQGRQVRVPLLVGIEVMISSRSVWPRAWWNARMIEALV